MSAGICIMNKNAVALAADSAVTIGNHAAIHNSANKLFALSKYEPVGAIVYANAEFMRVPVEIVIKEYKRSLGRTSFRELKDYVNSFIEYLHTNIELFHFAANEQNYVNSIFINLLNGLKNGYDNLIQAKVEEVQRELTDEELSQIASAAYDETIEFIDQQSINSTTSFFDYIKDNYYNSIVGYIASKFPWINESDREILGTKICMLYDRHFYRNGYVGISIAGYGKMDIFPRMFHLHLGGIINGQLRYALCESVTITENNPASINPFAQTDVMQTFLFGINDSFIQDMSAEIPKQINKKIKELDDSIFASGKKDVLQQQLSGATPTIIQQIAFKANQRYMQPILQSVATLPIEEMALLAESLINITSLRRKVALDGNIGTVGGPIDVAIISKGDGLVWMKRKHYFDLSHNLQYAVAKYSEIQNSATGANNNE